MVNYTGLLALVVLTGVATGVRPGLKCDRPGLKCDIMSLERDSEGRLIYLAVKINNKKM